MLKILLIRPGVTDFDEQGRIKGTLDIPLSDEGTAQVAKMIDELSDKARRASPERILKSKMSRISGSARSTGSENDSEPVFTNDRRTLMRATASNSLGK